MSNEDRFQEIYDKYNGLVWWYLHNKMQGSYADKEDVSQKIWQGVWEKIDRIEPGKEHAFLYIVIRNQICNYIRYSTRDRNFFRPDVEENSEGEEFSISDICQEIHSADDYAYFEIMDAVESVLTEKEFEVFMAYFQGLNMTQMVKQFHTRYEKLLKIFDSIKEKLTYEFDIKATFPNLKKRNRQKKKG